MIAGFAAGGATFGIWQIALAFVPWTSLRLLIMFVYAAPATVAGYSATHGIAQMVMPSPIWQIIFSFIAAIAAGMTAFTASRESPCLHLRDKVWHEPS